MRRTKGAPPFPAAFLLAGLVLLCSTPLARALPREGFTPGWSLRSGKLLLEIRAQPYAYRLVRDTSQGPDAPGNAPREPTREAGSPAAISGGRAVLIEHQHSGLRDGSRRTHIRRVESMSGGREWLSLTGYAADGVALASVRFEFPQDSVLRVTVRYGREVSERDRRDVRYAVRETFRDPGRRSYGVTMAAPGLGLDNRGHRVQLAGGRLFDRGGDWFSVRAPFFVTLTRAGALGIWTDTLWRGRYAFAVAGRTWMEFDDIEVDYYLLAGDDIPAVLELYSRPEYGGPSLLPPDWAMTSLWWRDDFHEDLRGPDGRTLEHMGQVILNDLEQLTLLKLPVGAVMLDRPHSLKGPEDEELPGWGVLTCGRSNDRNQDPERGDGGETPDNGTLEDVIAHPADPSGENGSGGSFRLDFPDARAILDEVRSRGVRVLSWTANRLVGDTRREAARLGLSFSDNQDAVDIRLPAGWTWWQDKLSVFPREYGIQGHMIDRGEEDGLLVTIRREGKLALKRVREVPDYLANLNAAAFPHLVADMLQRHFGADRYVYTRNAYDRARQAAGAWNGDARDWQGLRESVKHVLRSGLIHFPLWGSDVGGYKHPLWGWQRDDELFVRWAQFAAWTPHMHLVFGIGRAPWLDFDEQHLRAFAEAVRLKHDLLPLTRSLLKGAAETGTPVVRPLFLEFPTVEETYDRWQEYLFGSDLLVAPVLFPGARSRELYLPPGLWLDYHDRRTMYAGGGWRRLDAPLDRIPVLVRQGAIVSRGDLARFNNDWTPDWKPYLRVELFPSPAREGRFEYFRRNDGESRYGEAAGLQAGAGALQAETVVAAGFGAGGASPSSRVSTITLREEPGGIRVAWEPLEERTILEIYCTNPARVLLDGGYVGADTWSWDPQAGRLTMVLQGARAGELYLLGSRGPFRSPHHGGTGAAVH